MSAGWEPLRSLCVTACGLASSVALLLLFAAGAAGNVVICEPGPEIEDCTSPTGVTVDRDAAMLYVAHGGTPAIDAFDAEDGSFLASTPLAFSPRSIAVDNNPESEAQRDLYVYDATGNRVVKFHPSGGGSLEEAQAFGEGAFAAGATLDLAPGGVVYVADDIGGGDRRVQKFDREGEPVATPPACDALQPGEFGGNLTGFAVESSGGFYLASAGGRPIRRYDANCGEIASFHQFPGAVLGLAVDIAGTGDVFAAHPVELGEGIESSIFVHTAAGALVDVHYGSGILKWAIALAPFSSQNGDVFAVETAEGAGLNRVVHFAFDPPGPVVPGLPTVDPLSTRATLGGRINPKGKASTYRFEYVEEAAYQEDIGEGGDGFAEAESTATAPVEPAADQTFIEDPLFRLATVNAQIGCTTPADSPQVECLKPEATYRFRLVASNVDSGSEERFGRVGEFETKPPLRIESTWASEVGIDAARVSLEATPFGVPLTGRFQYVEESICLRDVENAEKKGAEDPAGHCFDRAQESVEISFGEVEGAVTRTAQLSSLRRGTAYRYRGRIENVLSEETGEARTFATFAVPGPEPCPNGALRDGGAAKLPDCRAYEMVSPVDKEGGEIRVAFAFTGPAELNQAAASVPAIGPGLTYSSVRAFGDATAAPYTSQYLASRAPGDGDGLWETGEGWGSHGISPPREGAKIVGGAAAGLDTQFTAFSEDLQWGWLGADSEPPLTKEAIAGYANLYRRDNARDAYRAICPVVPPATAPESYIPVHQGVSADGQKAFFRANDELTETAASGGSFQLYGCEIGTAQPVVVSVLPPARGGEASEGNSSAGTAPTGVNFREFNLHNAISADGERVYWTDSGTAGFGQGRIYLRERPFATGAECSGPKVPCTLAVSEAVGGEGSLATAHFWTASPDGSTAIFSFTAGPLAGDLHEFDAETGSAGASPIATGVSGLAGWSEDASRLYFVSTDQLTPEAAEGEENLFLYERGVGVRLVAAAPEAGGGCQLATAAPVTLHGGRCTRATPDGGQLAFTSRTSLTGYDNKDLGSGEAALEVLLYDAEAKGGEGELLCVSCNPGGARPHSRKVGGSQIPTAARLPGWQSAFHAPRALSSDGRRLFFESYDALLPADTNGALDVYQWERAGKGGCETTDANHFPQNGGCLELISSGEDGHDSRFLDASADGSDVFFKTSESLWGPDPGLVDIYDARVLGGFPEPDPPQPACEGETCQSPPAPPRQPAPSSSLFDGPGNLPAVKSCKRAARKAMRLSQTAKQLSRAAKRAQVPAKSQALQRRANRAAKRARGQARQAKRCRARAAAARRARR